MEPWQALECTFVNDNTAFVKIIKNTTNPTNKNETFGFNYTDSTDTETSTSVTVWADNDMNMTGLIQVPTGLTSIEETILPAGWKNNMTTQCSIVTYNQDQSEASRIDLQLNNASAILAPWEGLECTFVNDNTAFVKIIKNTTNPTDKNDTDIEWCNFNRLIAL